MITVLTWFWKQPGGRTDYTAEHVNIWAAMVRRHLRQPHRLACVTATPEGIDPRVEIIDPPSDFEAVRIPTWGIDKPQCLRRIAMFAPDAGKRFGERFVCMDLDCVIASPLDPLFETDARFKMYQGTNGARPYNGSMLYMVAGSRPQVYERFTPEDAAIAGQRFVGSDQAWISHVLGRGEAVWTTDDGVLWWGSSRNRLAPSKRVMFFPGQPKPWTIARTGEDPWLCEHYRGERSGKCLILGYAPSVWAEAQAVMNAGPVAAVIASPEAAEYWRGPILDVARNDREALRLARMYGFEDIAFCGRTELEAA
jgi:hypothetical protein